MRRETGPRESPSREEGLHELREAGPSEAEVLAVARRVLGDEDQLLHALRLERLRLPHEGRDRPRAHEAAHLRDRAERARVVAALGDLKVRIPLR